MSEQQILQKVKVIVAEQLRVGLDQVTPETSFVSDLGVDSLDQLELIMAIEEAFGIEISQDKPEEMGTVQQIVDYIVGQKVFA